jgi:hypothetical protein
MMESKFVWLFAGTLGFAMTGSGCGPVSLYHVARAADASDARGVRYTLPRTWLQVTAKVSVTRTTPGRFAALRPFFESAQCAWFVGGPCVAATALQPQAASPPVVRVRDVSLSDGAEPDPEQSYVIIPDDARRLTERTMRFELDDNGALTGTRVTQTDQVGAVVADSLGIVSRVVGGVFSIIGGSIPLGPLGTLEGPGAVRRLPPANAPDLEACAVKFPGARLLVDSVRSCPPPPTPGRPPANPPARCAVTNPSGYALVADACRAATTLATLEDLRTDIVRDVPTPARAPAAGQAVGAPAAPATGSAADASARLERILADMRPLQAQFEAVEQTSERDVSAVLVPDATNEYCYEVPEGGAVLGAPVAGRATLCVHLAPAGATPAVPANTAVAAEERGIAYRIPQVNEVRVTARDPQGQERVMLLRRVAIAQRGSVAFMHNEASRTGTLNVDLSARTGGLRVVEFQQRDYAGVNAQAVGTEIERITTAATTLVQAQRDAEDSLTLQRRQLQELLVARDIACMRYLGRACTASEATPSAPTTQQPPQ